MVDSGFPEDKNPALRAGKKRRHPVRIFLVGVIAVYFAWLTVQILSYHKYESRPEIARAEKTVVPKNADGGSPLSAVPMGAPEPVELRGAYHVHSVHSDGTKSVEGIAAAAERAGLDFVILTDHGAPNLASFDAQGKYGRVLVISGTEISSSRGHLVALGFTRPSQPFSQNADLAAREVKSLGGFTVIAHPYSKTRWSWGEQTDIGGIEVINGDSDIRWKWAGSLLYVPALFVKPSLALLKTLDPPTNTSRKWDQLLTKGDRENGPMPGFYALDIHRLIYGAALGLLNLHVQLDSLAPVDSADAARAVIDALRRGHFYSAVEAAADPAGFRFWTESDGRAPAGLRVRTPFPFAHETRLLCNGTTVASGTGPELIFEAREPGVYRVEVYLRARTPLHPGVPWILSNPIVIRKDVP